MVKRLSWPVALNAAGTGFATVEQGSSREILGAAENVVKTMQGSRAANPDFGTPDSVFTLGGADAQPFIDAVERWEPRAAVAVEVSDLEGMISRVRTEISA